MESMTLWPTVEYAIFYASSWSDPAVARINKFCKIEL